MEHESKENNSPGEDTFAKFPFLRSSYKNFSVIDDHFLSTWNDARKLAEQSQKQLKELKLLLKHLQFYQDEITPYLYENKFDDP